MKIAVVTTTKTVHLATERNGSVFPLCGGRHRLGVSADQVNLDPTCRTCRRRA